jgi:hypothetical protein
MHNLPGPKSKRRSALIGLLLVAHAASAQLISNGGFEDGLTSGSRPTQWNATGDFLHWTNPAKAHTGSQYAYFGIAADGTTPLTNGSGSIEQSISFVGDTPPITLSFWLWVASDEPSSPVYDHLYLEVLSDSGVLLATLADYSNADKAGPLASLTPAYQQKSFSLAPFASQPIRIRFRGSTGSGAGTIFRLDDVNVQGQACTYSFLLVPPGALGPDRTNLYWAVMTEGGCPWTVTSPNWIRVASGDGRLGSGSFALNINANTTTNSRTGTVLLLGQGNVIAATAHVVQTGSSNSGLLTGMRVSNGLDQFTLNGPQGGSYIVQASQNLLTWTPISTNTIPAGGFALVAYPADPSQRARFYRAEPSAP